jgi:hypothetical protein
MEISKEDAKILLSTIKELKQQKQQLLDALLIAGKYARENLPAAFPSDSYYANIYANGTNRDPEGREFANYWFHLARKD